MSLDFVDTDFNYFNLIQSHSTCVSITYNTSLLLSVTTISMRSHQIHSHWCQLHCTQHPRWLAIGLETCMYVCMILYMLINSLSF